MKRLKLTNYRDLATLALDYIKSLTHAATPFTQTDQCKSIDHPTNRIKQFRFERQHTRHNKHFKLYVTARK